VRPRNYVRSDERLRELINEQLTDADLDASDIEVKVVTGTVTLEGTVSQRWMKHQAEDIVDECSGVTDIHNHLRVQRPGQPANTPGQPAATTATPTAQAGAGAPDSANATATSAKERTSGSTEPTASSPPGEPNRKH
jgi:hypothetical protein